MFIASEEYRIQMLILTDTYNDIGIINIRRQNGRSLGTLYG